MEMKAKSKAVKELIHIIHKSPELFSANCSSGFESYDYSIKWIGNTRVLSTVSLEIGGRRFPLSYRDCWALEVAAQWWLRNVPLDNYST
jgi:hypothetical protein